MDETSSQYEPAPQERSRPGARRWIGPVAFLAIVVTPVLILIFSNTKSADLAFAGASWTAPLWIILAATFVAGALVTRLALWAWRAIRRRRQQQP